MVDRCPDPDSTTRGLAVNCKTDVSKSKTDVSKRRSADGVSDRDGLGQAAASAPYADHLSRHVPIDIACSR